MTKQEIIDTLTRSLGRTPTEQEITARHVEHLKARGFKMMEPAGKRRGYIMPTGRPPPRDGEL